ncbi:sensor histidine kinase [Candidatus Poriferisocius sp.]|uniref:sensor histidine kinase n=1 Tax=Candidatus Poriferisocius sp. TaxID=3101276 RepID=UPI003B01D9CB
MKLPRLAAGRRRPRLTVRVRMTVLVGLAAALVLIPATVFGPNRVEQALLNDVFDDEAAAQAENIEHLLDLMRQPTAVGAVPAEQSVQSEGSPLQSSPAEVDMSGFSASEASYLRDEARRIREALGDLDRLGHLDGLLRITRSNRQSGVPVVMGNGSLAAFSLGDRAEVRLLEPASVDSPVITVFGLNDLVYKAGGFETPGFADKLGRAGLDNDADRASQQIAFASRNVGGTDFVVAADVGNVIRSVDRIQSIMWLVAPLAVLAVVLVAWLLTGRALRPVERITEQVREINAGTLGERVPQPGTGDEIDRLATTMNTMLDRLEHSDTRLRQFVSDASHELRTPVAVLRSEAEVALRRPGDTPVGDLAAGVLDETQRLQRIVDDLLVLARHDESRSPVLAQAIDLDDVVLEEAARSRAIPIDVSAVSAGRVTASPDRAGRIVAHLLDNAARHARERAAVSLTTRSTSDPASTSGQEAVLTVDDDGPGIAEADRDRIFERFTRLSEARSRDTGGAGLGLAVVKALVTELGGQITVEDSLLGGARFTVTLPHTPL